MGIAGELENISVAREIFATNTPPSPKYTQEATYSLLLAMGPKYTFESLALKFFVLQNSPVEQEFLKENKTYESPP